MAAGRIRVNAVRTSCSLLESFEKCVKGLFSILALLDCEAFGLHFASSVVLKCDSSARLLVRWNVRQHVEQQLVVDLEERNAHGDLVIVTATHFREDLIDCSRDQTTVLVVNIRSAHRKCLACSGLAVAHDRCVDAVNYRMDSFLCAEFKHVLLGRVVQNFVVFEFPGLGLVVDYATLLIFGHSHRDCLQSQLA